MKPVESQSCMFLLMILTLQVFLVAYATAVMVIFTWIHIMHIGGVQLKLREQTVGVEAFKTTLPLVNEPVKINQVAFQYVVLKINLY